MAAEEPNVRRNLESIFANIDIEGAMPPQQGADDRLPPILGPPELAPPLLVRNDAIRADDNDNVGPVPYMLPDDDDEPNDDELLQDAATQISNIVEQMRTIENPEDNRIYAASLTDIKEELLRARFYIPALRESLNLHLVSPDVIYKAVMQNGKFKALLSISDYDYLRNVLGMEQDPSAMEGGRKRKGRATRKRRSKSSRSNSSKTKSKSKRKVSKRKHKRTIRSKSAKSRSSRKRSHKTSKRGRK